MIKIAVIDYGIGNTKSICSAIENCGAQASLTHSKDEIMLSDGVILPGVGAFAHGMEKLVTQRIDHLIKQFIDTGKPLLGICLGMQMLFEKSTEFGETAGLGVIPGEVLRLVSCDAMPEKLPHVSWNEIQTPDTSIWDRTILDGIESGEDMYFVHSYYAKPANEENILSVTEYSGVEFCSTVKYENVYGCQYHPEKSAYVGLKVIKNFIEICRGKYVK